MRDTSQTKKVSKLVHGNLNFESLKKVARERKMFRARHLAKKKFRNACTKICATGNHNFAIGADSPRGLDMSKGFVHENLDLSKKLHAS
jgi:hypothetical protein